ncbi:ComF family protein [Formosa algae]|uniref:ComF family protein n=1 Tax=Formosa algae TaxID=225843 RepID=A0A9X0YJH3_9FLAO|nr:phosphoribosyltransferase family protein [Formosa algae]MBP1840270.1 ComF family protein [Formosa algae]MDQ0334134.1 ComF family protein [Formosa algae]OEI79459.1 amidophosphoribosyltransferase [Formosa algae]
MFGALFNIFFPRVCYSCQNILADGEQTLCTDCRHRLPITQFHFNNDNSVANVLYGRVKIEQATALLRFEKKGITQKLMHQLKYKGKEPIGAFLGDWLGGELQTLDAYKSIDAVIPVPLHKNKLKKRGYNQVEKFGIQLAEALEAKYLDDVLIKINNTNSQVSKNRLSRWTNSDAVFSVQHLEKINNKHLLLVDDIITTGATMEACANLLLRGENVKISIATMAIA